VRYASAENNTFHVVQRRIITIIGTSVPKREGVWISTLPLFVSAALSSWGVVGSSIPVRFVHLGILTYEIAQFCSIDMRPHTADHHACNMTIGSTHELCFRVFAPSHGTFVVFLQ